MSDDDHPIEELTVFAILGAGFVGLFLDVEWFWMIWVLGFAVFLPAISVIRSHYFGDDDSAADDAAEDPLEALRERYASGELTEAEFERKVERLLETEDRESASDFVAESSADREREFET